MKHDTWPDESMAGKPFGYFKPLPSESCNDSDDMVSDDFNNRVIRRFCICLCDDHGNNGSTHKETVEEDRIARLMKLKEIVSRNKERFSKLPSAKTRDVSSDSHKTETDYPILLTAFALIAVTSLIAALNKETWHLSLTGWMHGFMAGFFLLFGFVKLMDLRAFARAFARYDLVAARVPLYGLLYPFMEIGVAWLYIIIPHSPTLNAFCLTWMLLGAAGALRGLLQRRGAPVACACMGSRIRLPLSWITVAEYLLMALMALPGVLRL